MTCRHMLVQQRHLLVPQECAKLVRRIGSDGGVKAAYWLPLDGARILPSH